MRTIYAETCYGYHDMKGRQLYFMDKDGKTVGRYSNGKRMETLKVVKTKESKKNKRV